MYTDQQGRRRLGELVGQVGVWGAGRLRVQRRPPVIVVRRHKQHLLPRLWRIEIGVAKRLGQAAGQPGMLDLANYELRLSPPGRLQNHAVSFLAMLILVTA
jgi:hypothetical protein